MKYFKPGDLVIFDSIAAFGLAGKTGVIVKESDFEYDDYPDEYEVLVDGHVVDAFETWMDRLEDLIAEDK